MRPAQRPSQQQQPPNLQRGTAAAPANIPIPNGHHQQMARLPHNMGAPPQQPPQHVSVTPRGQPSQVPPHESEILALARQLHQRMSDGDKQSTVAQFWSGLTDQQRQQLQQENRQVVTEAFIDRARQMRFRQGARQTQHLQIGNQGQALPPSAPQPAGAPNFDHNRIIGQQARAIKSQASGGEVVPASDPAKTNNNPAQTHRAANVPQGVTPQMMANFNNNDPANSQMLGQMQQQPAERHRQQYLQRNTLLHQRALQQAQNQLRGQPGGLNAPNALNGGQANSPAMNMNMLNRPIAPPDQAAPSAVHHHQARPQGPPQAPIDGVSSQSTRDHHQMMNSNQPNHPFQFLTLQEQQQLRECPPGARVRLATMAPEHISHVLATFRASRGNMPGRQMANPGPISGVPANSIAGSTPGLNPQQLINHQTQLAPTGTETQPRSQNVHQMIQQHALNSMRFPRELLTHVKLPVPDNIDTWGKLQSHISMHNQNGIQDELLRNVAMAKRRWVLANPEPFQIALRHVTRAYTQRQQQWQLNQGQSRPPPNGSVPPGGMRPPSNGPAPPAQMMQAVTPGQQQQPRLQTTNRMLYDIQKIRAQYPNLEHQTDEKILMILSNKTRAQQLQMQNPPTQDPHQVTRNPRQFQTPEAQRPGLKGRAPQGHPQRPQQAPPVPLTQGQKRPGSEDVMEIPDPHAPLPRPNPQQQHHLAQLRSYALTNENPPAGLYTGPNNPSEWQTYNANAAQPRAATAVILSKTRAQQPQMQNPPMQDPHQVIRNPRQFQTPEAQRPGLKGRAPQGHPQRPQQAPPVPLTQGQKRPGSEDVMEIPDPHAPLPRPNPQQQHHNAQLRSYALTNGNAPAGLYTGPNNPTERQTYNANAAQQRAATAGAGPQRQVTQRQAQQLLNLDATGEERARVNQIAVEIARANPKGPAQNLDPRQREYAQGLMRRITSHGLKALGKTVYAGLRILGEDRLREVLQTRCVLLHNTTDTNGTIKGYLSVNLEWLRGAEAVLTRWILDLKKFKDFRDSMMDSAQQQSGKSAAGPPQSQPSAPQQQRPNMVNLDAKLVPGQSASNVDCKPSQRSPPVRKATKVPPAPTDDKSFDWSAAKPLPKYEPGKNELTRDKLKIPHSKRRKTGQTNPSSISATATATPGTATETSKSAKAASPEQIRNTAAPVVPENPRFVCKEPFCEGAIKSFDTETALKQHQDEAHGVITDPLQFLLGAVDKGLAEAGLDPHGNILPSKARAPSRLGATSSSSVIRAKAIEKVQAPMSIRKAEPRTPGTPAANNKPGAASNAPKQGAGTTEKAGKTGEPKREKTLLDAMCENIDFPSKIARESSLPRPVDAQVASSIKLIDFVDASGDPLLDDYWGDLAASDNSLSRPRNLDPAGSNSSPELTPGSTSGASSASAGRESDIDEDQRLLINLRWDPTGNSNTSAPMALIQALGLHDGDAGSRMAGVKGEAAPDQEDGKKKDTVAGEFEWSRSAMDWDAYFAGDDLASSAADAMDTTSG